MWKKCLDCIDELLDILFDNNNIFIGENIAEDSENLGISDQVVHPPLPSQSDICLKVASDTEIKSNKNFYGTQRKTILLCILIQLISNIFLCFSAVQGAWVHLNSGGEDGRGVYQDHAEHRSPLSR